MPIASFDSVIADNIIDILCAFQVVVFHYILANGQPVEDCGNLLMPPYMIQHQLLKLFML